MQGVWDNIAPTYNTFTGDGMMAPATELIIAAVQRHWADRPGVRLGAPADCYRVQLVGQGIG